jgi:hypothetical protein
MELMKLRFPRGTPRFFVAAAYYDTKGRGVYVPLGGLWCSGLILLVSLSAV